MNYEIILSYYYPYSKLTGEHFNTCFSKTILKQPSRPGLVLGVNGGPDGAPPPPLTLPTDQGANRPYSSDGPVMEIICPDLQKNII